VIALLRTRSLTLRLLALAVALALVGAPLAVTAQPPGKARRMGFVSMRSGPADNPHLDAFRQGLRDLGYQEGRDVVLEVRYADGKQGKLPDLVAEMMFGMARAGQSVMVRADHVIQ
jgi:putative ABC transport system substrate-binding protein